MKIKVLYEDNHLIAVMKPAGIAVQDDETKDKCMIDYVKEYLKEKYQKPGNVFLGTLHRLDRPVSGILLFAKTSKGAARLSEQFRNHTVQKTYHALVEGEIKKKKGTLVNFLIKDKKKNVVSVFDMEVPESQNAELDYEVVKSNKKNSLVKINLKTGRPHQIRAQFSHLGHPIVGDTKYGGQQKYKKGELALCATNLSFQMATSGEKIDLEIDVPFVL